MKFELNTYHRNVSNEELLEDVRKVADSLGQSFLTTAD